MAVRGDDPLKIMQRAGHKNFKTTQGYLRAAEMVGNAAGEPFPKLPISLLGLRESHAPIARSTLSARDLVEPPGIEPGRSQRFSALGGVPKRSPPCVL